MPRPGRCLRFTIKRLGRAALASAPLLRPRAYATADTQFCPSTHYNARGYTRALTSNARAGPPLLQYPPEQQMHSALLAVLSYAALQAVTAQAPATVPQHRCPFGCHGHGYCTGDAIDRCECWAPWTGAACHERACPEGPAWSDYASSAGTAHALAVCSNRGLCDTGTGRCQCAAGFEGAACQRRVCPTTVKGVTCSGHGRCESMAERAQRHDGRSTWSQARYTGWDASSMQGCVCDPGWSGADCSQPACPLGVDPIGHAGVEQQVLRIDGEPQVEHQRIRVGTADTSGWVPDEHAWLIYYEKPEHNLPGGFFRLQLDARYAVADRAQAGVSAEECAMCHPQHRQLYTTIPIEIEYAGTQTQRGVATAAAIKAALEALPLVDEVDVGALDLSSAPAAGNPGNYGWQFTVTFTGENVRGRIPALAVLDETTYGLHTSLTSWAYVAQLTSDRVSNPTRLAGYVVLSYDDSATVRALSITDVGALDTSGACPVSAAGWPATQPAFRETPAGSAQCIGIGAAASTVKAVLESMASLDSVGVEATIFASGTQWALQYDVYFNGSSLCQGDIAQLGVSSQLEVRGSGVGGTLGATGATIANGRYLQGLGRLSIAYGVDTWTGDVDISAPDAALANDIMAWDLGAGATSRVGQVAVLTRVPLEQSETAREYVGARDIIITFHDADHDMDAAQPSVHTLDASPTDAGSGGASFELVSQSSPLRTFELASSVTEQFERQLFTLQVDPGVPDQDAAFVLTFAPAAYVPGTSTSSLLPAGCYLLGMDTSAGKCPLCAVQQARSLSGADGECWQFPHWPEADYGVVDRANAAHMGVWAARLAAALQDALSLLPNIGPGGALVTGAWSSPNVLLTAQFVGLAVGGSIDAAALTLGGWSGAVHSIDAELRDPAASLTDRGPRPASLAGADRGALSLSRTQAGDILGGSVTWELDLAAPGNAPPVPTTTAPVTLDLTAMAATGITPSAIEAVLESQAEVDDVTVQIVYTGGAGLRFYVTFDGTQVAGTRAPARITSCSITHSAGPGTATCSVQDGLDPSCGHCAKGTHIQGTWQAQAEWNGAIMRTGDLAASISASALQDELRGLAPSVDSVFASLTVTRSTTSSAHGEYVWTVTFPDALYDDLTLRPVNLRLAAALTSTGQLSYTVGNVTIALVGDNQAQQLAVAETQLLECSCGTGSACSGSIVLRMWDRASVAIAWDSTASQLSAALQSMMPELGRIDVSHASSPSGTSQLCAPSVAVTTEVRFAQAVGNVPPLRLFPAEMGLAADAGSVDVWVRAGTSTPPNAGNAGFVAKDGTRRGAVCSDRGVCQASSTAAATCACDTAHGAQFSGAACQAVASTPTACPGQAGQTECSGHGTCNQARGWVCECQAGYRGRDCSQPRCPAARAWLDEAATHRLAHRAQECAGEGVCSAAGRCTCQSTAWAGGLRCSQGTCGRASGQACKHGICASMAQLAGWAVDGAGQHSPRAYQGWDEHMLHGCHCPVGPAYVGPYAKARSTAYGYQCAELACPASADPKVRVEQHAGVPGVQRLQCSADSASNTLQISFLNVSTPAIPAATVASASLQGPGTPAATLEQVLNALSTIGRVTVSQVQGSTVCDVTLAAGSASIVDVTFHHPQGAVPLLQVQGTGTFTAVPPAFSQHVSSTFVPLECSGRGMCDHRSGRCECAPQFGSSDGAGAQGLLGDCGNYSVLHNFTWAAQGGALYYPTFSSLRATYSQAAAS